MPRISKVRIVNFNYNDGNRLIADELFDFTNIEGNNALNVLINLANGGGKSVLVQLMMQPILPKAKVANRKIESFFQKLGSHCYVVLEWLKDNSSERLLTGISMAARETSANDEEDARGASVKYYTFYANYTTDASPYSIANLPLSQKERGRFVPAEFDAIRKLARTSKGQLTYYASDDSLSWKNKLSEYGLSQEEWRMIEQLNSEEGGLGKYFGKFKTSDALVDGLLIPNIERKLTSVQGKEDDSLATMLLAYAKQYASHQEVLREKEVYEAFERELQQLKPQAEQLWNADDQLKQDFCKMFGLLDVLTANIRDLQSEQQKADETITSLQAQREHIHWEEASAQYYLCKEAFEAAALRLEEANAALQECTDQIDHNELEIKKQECARYLQQLREAQTSISEIQKEIQRRENGSQDGGELASLKYSAACEIRSVQEQHAPQLAKLQEQEQGLLQQIHNQTLLKNEAEQKQHAAQAEVNRTEGKLELVQKTTDGKVGQLHADLYRRLDGRYAAEELEQIRSARAAEVAAWNTKKETAECEQKELEEKEEALPEQKLSLKYKESQLHQQVETLRQELDAYHQQENRLHTIFDQHNLDFSQRFTNRLEAFLATALKKNDAAYADILRKISIAEEALTAAKRGSLHVPHAVIAYLNSTGVTYTTCEKYLLDAVENGNLTKEKCLEILQKYPTAAYGIVMDDEANKQFFAFGREKWLPSMVPIFSHDQLNQILNVEKIHFGSIAFYDEEYFADKEHFVLHLEAQRTGYAQKRDLLTEQKKQLESQLRTAEAFIYPESWEQDQQRQIAQREKETENIQTQLAELEKQWQALRSRKAELSQQVQSFQEQITALGETLRLLDEIHHSLEDEEKLHSTLFQQVTVLDTAKQAYETLRKNVDNLQQTQTQLHDEIQKLSDLLQKLKEAQTEVGDCPQAKRIAGTWQELLERYRAAQNALNAELSSLQGQLQDKQALQQDAQKGIDRQNLPQEAYQDVAYSELYETELYQVREQLQREKAAADKQMFAASQESGREKANLDHANTSLERYGAPLEKAEVGADFENRLQKLRTAEKQMNDHQKEWLHQQKQLERVYGKAENFLDGRTRPAEVIAVSLEADCLEQYNRMKATCTANENSLKKQQQQVTSTLQSLESHFQQEKVSVLRDSISSMAALLNNELRGDRYYTLTMHIEGNIENAQREIGRITTNLKEFDNQRNDLIHHCTIQGERIYTGLRQMEASSQVNVHAGKPRQKMIRFDIPDAMDAAVSTASVAEEIDQGVKELVQILQDDSATEVKQRQKAQEIVGSKRLLRKYIGRDSIQVKAYKIDQNPQNSGYRTWEKTQVNNSGAEKFVVYFAVILSLIHYTRGDLNDIPDKELHSALILDNPFGATSSKHILTPMFQIAKHFQVQMICLSDINKSDVVNCFDMVIKAIVKKRPMSNSELLTHEGNEQIEHGFYRAEQMTLDTL